MTRLTFVAPGHWWPLAQALTDHGFQASRLWPQGQDDRTFSRVTPAAALELKKALRCHALPDDVFSFLDGLSASLGMVAGLGDALFDQQPHAIITNCTHDAPGRIAAAAARGMGVPLIHVQHGCHAVRAEDAWYCAEAPGDYVLAPGERDAAWWFRCNPQANITVTGHALWDYLAGMTWQRPATPTVVWLAESGANPYQTRAIYESRDAPDVAWREFVAVREKFPANWRVIVKLRQGESGPVADRWRMDALRTGMAVSDAHLSLVLPEASLVIGQDSGGLVEAATLGIPVISLTRPGGELFDRADGVPVLRIDREDFSAALLDEIRYRMEPRDTSYLKEVALRFNAGAKSGGSVERICQTISHIVIGDEQRRAVNVTREAVAV